MRQSVTAISVAAVILFTVTSQSARADFSCRDEKSLTVCQPEDDLVTNGPKDRIKKSRILFETNNCLAGEISASGSSDWTSAPYAGEIHVVVRYECQIPQTTVPQSDTGKKQRTKENVSAKYDFACALSVGEIVLLHTALDTQLNHIVIDVMHLTHSTMLESVVATLDPRQKIEILKSRATHIKQKTWQKALKAHADRLEHVARIRNSVCHTPLVPNKMNGSLEFAPSAATKILKSMTIVDAKNYRIDRMTIDRAREVIPLAERALGGGEQIRSNFAKIRSEMERKKSQAGT
jgi:hypothetical protein